MYLILANSPVDFIELLILINLLFKVIISRLLKEFEIKLSFY